MGRAQESSVLSPTWGMSWGVTRLVNGSGNNPLHPTWGMSGTPFIRSKLQSFPATNMPSPRTVSTALFTQQAPMELQVPTSSLTDLFTYFGLFVSQDVAWAETNSSEQAPIPLPEDDWAAPYLASIPFERSRYQEVAGVREQLNSNTAFLDAELVYGNNEARAAALRSFSGGRLKTDAHGGPPFDEAAANSCGCPIQNPRGLSPSKLQFTGNERANVAMPIAALQAVFLREHNRQCAQLQLQEPSWDDEHLYQRARCALANALLPDLVLTRSLVAA